MCMRLVYNLLYGSLSWLCELYFLVYPAKYQKNIMFENGTFILLQSFSNVSGFGEDSDFTVTIILQV